MKTTPTLIIMKPKELRANKTLEHSKIELEFFKNHM
jgi:hypothetical protein